MHSDPILSKQNWRNHGQFVFDEVLTLCKLLGILTLDKGFKFLVIPLVNAIPKLRVANMQKAHAGQVHVFFEPTEHRAPGADVHVWRGKALNYLTFESLGEQGPEF